MYDDPKLKGRATLVLFGAFLAVFFTAFEVRQPVISLGPLQFTTTELAADFFLLTVAAWAAVERGDFFSRRALDVAVALFVISNLLSVGAAVDKGSAFKFALRMTGAALIYFGVSRLPAKARSHLIVTGAITVTLLVVTVVGLVEYLVPGVFWSYWLSPWQQGQFSFGTFYNVRVSSTLPFPTVLSMYLELAAPLALVLGIWFIYRDTTTLNKKRWLAAAVVAGLTAVTMVQVYTFTRSALVSSPLLMMSGAGLALVYGYGRRVAAFFALGAAILAVVIVGATVFSNKMAVRLNLAEQVRQYGAEYSIIAFPDSVLPGQHYTARLRIKNTSDVIWSPTGADRVIPAYRWNDYPQKKDVLDVDFLSQQLPHDVAPGEVVEVDLRFATPREPGHYVLQMELAKGGVGWFSGDKDVPPAIVPLEIDANGSRPLAITETSESFVIAAPAAIQPTRRVLWKAAVAMWRDHPLLGVGPGQFRVVYPEYAPEAVPDERLETHNVYISALANTGLVGLAAMIYLLGRTTWLQFRLVRNRQLKFDVRLIALGLLTAMVAYTVHGLLDYFLWQTGVTFLFFALLGLTAWLDRQARAA